MKVLQPFLPKSLAWPSIQNVQLCSEVVQMMVLVIYGVYVTFRGPWFVIYSYTKINEIH